VIVRIGGIVDCHCLTFLFIIHLYQYYRLNWSGKFSSINVPIAWSRWGCRGCDSMVVGCTTTYAISVYHN
jgi:hypothetical protein